MMWSRFAKPLCPPTGDYWCGSPRYSLFFTLVLRGHSVDTALGQPVRWPRRRLAGAVFQRPLSDDVWGRCWGLFYLSQPRDAVVWTRTDIRSGHLTSQRQHKRVRVRSWHLCVARKMNSECFYLFKAWISFYIQSFPVQTIMNISDISSTKMAIIKGWWYSKWIVIRAHIYLTSLDSRLSRMAVILCRYTQRRSLLYFKYLPWYAQPKTFTLHSSPFAPLMCVF